jgi:hypothetical protein
VQIVNNQINNAFNVLKDRSNLRIKLESIFMQTTCDSQSQLIFKFRNQSFNNKKTTKSSQNEKLWRHNRHFLYCNTTFEIKKMTRWFLFWSIRVRENTIFWLFKNFDATSAYRRRIIRLTSTFISCIKNRKTNVRVFTLTLN